MKKTLFLFLTIFALSSSAQLSKADFVSTFTKFPLEKMQSLYIKNVRTYYTNGTNSLEQEEYEMSIFTYELTETALHLFFHEDATKTKMMGVMIYPYNQIITMSASAQGMTLELVH